MHLSGTQSHPATQAWHITVSEPLPPPCAPALQDLCAFVDAAHAAGLAVIVDVVLHHGAPEGNALWEYDGWGPDNNGGIYHEGAPDTEWGRQLAFWKGEVGGCCWCCCWCCSCCAGIVVQRAA